MTSPGAEICKSIGAHSSAVSLGVAERQKSADKNRNLWTVFTPKSEEALLMLRSAFGNFN